MHKYKFLVEIIKNYIGSLINILIITLICALIMLSYPYINSIIIDQVFYAGNISYLYKIILFLTILYIFNELLLFINYLIHHYLSKNLLQDLKSIILKRVFSLKSTYLGRIELGEIGTIINYDSHKLTEIIIDYIFNSILIIARLIFILIIMLSISPLLAVSLFAIALSVAIVNKFFGKKITTRQTNLREHYGLFVSIIIELIQGVDYLRRLFAKLNG